MGECELRIHSLWSYGRAGPARILQQRLKYGGDFALAHLLGQLLAKRLLDLDFVSGKLACLVPIPIHPVRFLERGYNQAEEISKGMSAVLRCPLYPNVLDRPVLAGSQVGSSAAERRQNLSGAFVLTDPKWIRGRHVILVDDVCTTGATLCEAQQALEGGLPADVLCATVFRSNPER